MLKDIKAAIFDMDGTLVDSMWIWDKLDKNFLEKRGIKYDENLKHSIGHLSFQGTVKYFKEHFKLEESEKEISDIFNNMAYDEYKNNVTLKSGAKEFLQMLKEKGIKIGLATSNSIDLLEVTLKANGIYEYFDAITITDEVSKGKNCPDVYLLSAKKLGVNPCDCVVFEDILPAIQGAKLANMKVVAVYDKHSDPHRDEIIKEAHKHINCYSEINEAV
ncbi:HAD family hydrolase [Clostridium frigidicarnis]|uniref:Haloacid dehalogenase superfamily, subfamily IA, variant 3 with third motif having DD or ED/haloacid dehalogenase superfamily, subfamily IA, variant 1 with third motif having Dx(3-4)D or Dx(3-4)E n=1 Tax=Clostridium frigidicarnis TaxID=84698 RepID=A0A1I1B4K6_9CLOT|nr:HAD family phosphatase [Clostridium frigidicarnis]SFB45275.1 haloacid dehalogenase superfamily, subfamily IA, variant 3 with third motif having DD or ED/haloacid dehalogenase superfamily, subfamily IA, variant 1 with third motif having Dx(3-4)D or Dx(3-4)E [Clostridium frigidicarnis]